MSEEYHYVSSASSSSSSAAAAPRNMPVHITSEQGCVIETVISHFRGAALCALFPPRAGRAEVHLSALLRKRSRLHARWARRPAVTSPSPRAARVRTADSHTTLRQCSSSTTLPPPSIHPSIHPYKCQPQTFTPQSLELNWAPAARTKKINNTETFHINVSTLCIRLCSDYMCYSYLTVTVEVWQLDDTTVRSCVAGQRRQEAFIRRCWEFVGNFDIFKLHSNIFLAIFVRTKPGNLIHVMIVSQPLNNWL